MKKLVSIIMAAALALSMSLTAMAADTARSVGSYSSVSTRYDYTWTKLTHLEKNFSMKNYKLEVKENELLYIPKDVKLYLYKGAEINGSIYVENGGYLYIKGGDVSVSEGGAIYSDGYVSVSSKSKLTLDRNSEIFVGKVGTLKLYSDESYDADSLGDIICLGKTSSKLDIINKKAIAAYVSDENGTVKSDDPASLLPTYDQFNSPMGSVDWGKRQRIVFVFDKGACLRTDKRARGGDYYFKFVGNTCVGAIGNFTYKDLDGLSSTKYNEISIINGNDYCVDINIGIGLVELTDDLKSVNFSDSDPMVVDALSDLSKHKYLGKSKRLGDNDLYFAENDLYLMDNGYILAISKLGTNNSYADYRDKTEKELEHIYEYGFFKPV